MAVSRPLWILRVAFISILAILSSTTVTQNRVATEASVQQSPYFSINVSPSSLTVTQGSTAQAALTITSLNGFSTNTLAQCGSAYYGNLDLRARVLPSTAFGFLAVPNPSCLTLKSGDTANATLVVSATSLGIPGTYNVTVTASFQGSPSGPVTWSSTTVSVHVIQDGPPPSLASIAVAGGIAGAAVISGLVLVWKRVGSGKRSDDLASLREG